MNIVVVVLLLVIVLLLVLVLHLVLVLLIILAFLVDVVVKNYDLEVNAKTPGIYEVTKLRIFFETDRLTDIVSCTICWSRIKSNKMRLKP